MEGWFRDDAPRNRGGVFHPEVESLRGIAALTVLLFHAYGIKEIKPSIFDTFNADNWLNFFATTVFNGTGAVMLFFVISGYVLGLNLKPDDHLDIRFYTQFAVRRVFRIMPALWLWLAFSISVLILFHKQHPALRDVVAAALLGHEAQKFNGPLWSLEVEMAASIVYPFALFAARGMRGTAQAIVAVVLSYWAWRGTYPYWWMQYAFCFQLGIMIPTVGRTLIDITPKRVVPYLFLGGILAIEIPTNLSRIGLMNSIEHSLIEGWASFVVLACVLYGGLSGVADFLKSRPARFLGKISYSLYLLHYPVMSLMANIAFPYWGGGRRRKITLFCSPRRSC